MCEVVHTAGRTGLSVSIGSTSPCERKLEEQVMFHNLGLPTGQMRIEGFCTPFEEHCARSDECQRLADRHPSLKQQYEALAHQWLELSRHGEHARA